MKYLKIKALFAGTMLVLITSACNQKSGEESDSLSINASYPVQIVAGRASLSKVSGDYTFDSSNSPLYLDGYLYFTNNNFDPPQQSRTLRMSSSGDIETLVTDNGVIASMQASGKGTIYACEMLGHRVVELNTDGEVLRVVADQYNGTRIDGPNDMVVDKKGGIYFSDSQFIAGREKMQETPAVYYVNPQGKVVRVIDDIEFPNGMVLSPDGTTLYVANTNNTHLLAYNVNEDGSVENRSNFAAVQLAEGSEVSGADGMAIDVKGNVYVATTQGLGIQVFNSQGEHLGNIPTPTPPSNLNFGGEDQKILYISARDGIYSIPVKIAGFSSY